MYSHFHPLYAPSKVSLGAIRDGTFLAHLDHRWREEPRHKPPVLTQCPPPTPADSALSVGSAEETASVSEREERSVPVLRETGERAFYQVEHV